MEEIFLKIALAESDGAFESVLGKYLPQVIESLETNQQKALEIITHVKKRVTSRPEWDKIMTSSLRYYWILRNWSLVGIRKWILETKKLISIEFIRSLKIHLRMLNYKITMLKWVRLLGGRRLYAAPCGNRTKWPSGRRTPLCIVFKPLEDSQKLSITAYDTAKKTYPWSEVNSILNWS